VELKELLDLGSEAGVGALGLKKPGTAIGGKIERAKEEIARALVGGAGLGVGHAPGSPGSVFSISRLSQTRAKAQSRLTVAGERPVAVAVSSMERPAK